LPLRGRAKAGRAQLRIAFFVLFFFAVFFFVFLFVLFFLIWLLSKEDIGSYQPVEGEENEGCCRRRRHVSTDFGPERWLRLWVVRSVSE